MLPYLLPLPTPLIPVPFTNGRQTYRFAPRTVLHQNVLVSFIGTAYFSLLKQPVMTWERTNWWALILKVKNLQVVLPKLVRLTLSS
jgi:hypothetical protein